MKRIFPRFWMAFLLLGLLAAPAAAKSFPLTFTPATYIKIYAGTADGVDAATKGELLNRSRRPIGAFSVVSLDQFEAIVRVELTEGE